MRCVIIGNAPISDYEKCKSYFKTDDYFVFCDGGLKHKERLGVEPDFIVGDFDSYEMPKITENMLVLPTVKDDTDTFAAVKLMLDKGYSEFLFVGVIGERLDHTLGNISILLYLKNHNAVGVIVDDYSEMFLLKDSAKISKNSCSYFSIVSLGEKLEGVDIIGAKYPLENAVIQNSYQFAVSNEPVNDTEISAKKGEALIIKVF